MMKRVQRVRDLERAQSAIELATKDKNNRKRFKKENTSEEGEEDFLVDDYHSDDEKNDAQSGSSNSHLSKEVRELLQK